jgi:saccharopine dehydrogenase-like NADP-dependent oxidoreductase
MLGAGKIGRMITRLLLASGDYDVLVGDHDVEALDRIRRQSDAETQLVDVDNRSQLLAALDGRETVISALSFQHNPAVAQAASDVGANYFDLTEDVQTTRRVRAISQKARAGQVFMPQCGLAPGFISIIANHLTKSFDKLDTVRMRVGALPQFPTGSLKYNLTWSTDGLINEYCNPCEAIHAGERVNILPLEGLEHFSLDGIHYEAFNTSGGLGTLCETLTGQVRELNYKTVRYVGHRDPMLLLVDELRLGERRELLKNILEAAVPVTYQDVVVTFCTVTGMRKGQLVQISDARKMYHQMIDGVPWSAIQITTAAGVCAVLDLYVAGRLPNTGFVRQEDVDFDDFIRNRFGRHYGTTSATRFSRDTTVASETAEAYEEHA